MAKHSRSDGSKRIILVITIKAGQQLPGFAWLKDDGTTACGNWLYSGSWTEAGAQMQTPWHRRSFRAWHLSELGLVVAGESARDVQPRFLRSIRQAVGHGTTTSLVE